MEKTYPSVSMTSYFANYMVLAAIHDIKSESATPFHNGCDHKLRLTNRKNQSFKASCTFGLLSRNVLEMKFAG